MFRHGEDPKWEVSSPVGKLVAVGVQAVVDNGLAARNV